jgi:hypothetical protein
MFSCSAELQIRSVPNHHAASDSGIFIMDPDSTFRRGKFGFSDEVVGTPYKNRIKNGTVTEIRHEHQ